MKIWEKLKEEKDKLKEAQRKDEQWLKSRKGVQPGYWDKVKKDIFGGL